MTTVTGIPEKNLPKLNRHLGRTDIARVSSGPLSLFSADAKTPPQTGQGCPGLLLSQTCPHCPQNPLIAGFLFRN